MSKGARKGTRNRKDEVHYIKPFKSEDPHWLKGKKAIITGEHLWKKK